MLLRANCIRERECEHCDFRNECIVQRIMYSSFEHKPAYVTTGESVGYVIECEDYHEEFKSGDKLYFNLILFGKNIVYFNQYMQAICALGQNGLGSDNALFTIESVTNTYKEPILCGTDIYMERYKVATIEDYVRYRLNVMDIENSITQDSCIKDIKCKFKTPFSSKYQGEFIRELNTDAVVASISRRLEVLDAFEGIDGSLWNEILGDYRQEVMSHENESSEITDSKEVSIRRYSNRKGQAMYLKGVVGSFSMSGVPIEVLVMLIAAELIHCGKNTSFGFGRIQVSREV